jgi:hypothetical protein
MKIRCSFCSAVDSGTQPELQDRGWSKAIIYAPIRKSVAACSEHYYDLNNEVMRIVMLCRKQK